MPTIDRIAHVEFRRFKAFTRFVLPLRHFNILDAQQMRPLSNLTSAVILTLISAMLTLAYGEEPAIVTPSCVKPARLEQRPKGESDFWIILKSDADDGATQYLLRKYGLMIHSHIVFPTDYSKQRGFSVLSLTPAEIAELRCEQEVEYVSVPRGT
jgi:hypothetical protein